MESRAFKGGALLAIPVVIVVAGVTVAILAGGGRRSIAVSHTTTGTIAFSRNTNGGTFNDGAGPVFQVTPRGAVERTNSPSTCCLTASGATRRFVVAMAASKQPRLVSIGHHVTSPIQMPTGPATLRLTPGAWSPDGRSLALAGVDQTAPTRNGVYEMSVVPGNGAEGRALRRVTVAQPGRPQRPLSYAPDGRSLLLYQKDPAGRFGTLYVTRRGGRPSRVGSTRVMCCYFGAPASWSPDGRSVTFAGFDIRKGVPLGRSAVFVASATGKNVRRITAWGKWTTSAAWSPSHDWIVFDRGDTDGVHSEFLVRPDGSALHEVDTDPATKGSCCAQWSPDGKYLVYQHLENGDENHVALYVVNATGSAHSRRATKPDGGYMSFGWIP